MTSGIGRARAGPEVERVAALGGDQARVGVRRALALGAVVDVAAGPDPGRVGVAEGDVRPAGGVGRVGGTARAGASGAARATTASRVRLQRTTGCGHGGSSEIPRRPPEMWPRLTQARGIHPAEEGKPSAVPSSMSWTPARKRGQVAMSCARQPSACSVISLDRSISSIRRSRSSRCGCSTRWRSARVGVEEHLDLVEAHPRRLVPQDHRDPYEVVAAVAPPAGRVAVGPQQPDLLPVPQHVRLEVEPGRDLADRTSSGAPLDFMST